MQIRELLSDDDAVSPVIGVILMVAITVILAAVIASFVLGLGDQAQSTTPQASFSFEYDGSADTTDGEGLLTITHDGGDTIQGDELYVRGSGFTSSSNDDTSSSDMNGDNSDETWESADSDSPTEVRAGMSLYVAVNNDYQINVVYEATEGDSSATLGSDSGPEA